MSPVSGSRTAYNASNGYFRCAADAAVKFVLSMLCISSIWKMAFCVVLRKLFLLLVFRAGVSPVDSFVCGLLSDVLGVAGDGCTLGDRG